MVKRSLKESAMALVLAGAAALTPVGCTDGRTPMQKQIDSYPSQHSRSDNIEFYKKNEAKIWGYGALDKEIFYKEMGWKPDRKLSDADKELAARTYRLIDTAAFGNFQPVNPNK